MGANGTAGDMRTLCFDTYTASVWDLLSTSAQYAVPTGQTCGDNGIIYDQLSVKHLPLPLKKIKSNIRSGNIYWRKYSTIFLSGTTIIPFYIRISL